MMTKLGIVIDKVSKERLEGCLMYVGASLKIDDDGNIKVGQKAEKITFSLTFGSRNIIEVLPGTPYPSAQRVSSALRESGFENLVLMFCGHEYEIESQPSQK